MTAHARRRTVAAGILVLLAGSALVLALLLSAGSGHASRVRPTPPPSVRAEVPLSRASHVVVIVMENEEYGEVIGSPKAPYINRLARRYGLMTQSFAITHPSLPNYIALTSGSTHGISSDCTDCGVSAPNIVDQLEHAGISWGAYLEELPSPCFLGARSGLYVKKHNPFAYYADIVRSPSRCARVAGFDRLAIALRTGRLPTYVWITPNLCNDAHDCDIQTGDRFLAQNVPALLRELGPHGFLVLTFDEGVTNDRCCGVARGGRIPTLVAGPDVRRGARVSTPIDSYGVLGSVEHALGLPPLGGAADPRSGRLGRVFVRTTRLR